MSAWVVVLVVVLVVLFYDSDRVGRGERSRASDACEKRMRLLAWTERISHAEAMLSAAVNSSSLYLCYTVLRYWCCLHRDSSSPTYSRSPKTRKKSTQCHMPGSSTTAPGGVVCSLTAVH